ncbi:protein Diedel-like isoform X2 [Leptopilina heterotoma]|uniref:protein Diedel-like isoform X2 n=1 Tax=Leptopilina heterotoma TaxID=63436 RepID=UPI001CA7B8D4|nr:protein Diedel-like isoform X2 [Leptopilina heterotoma]
MFNFSLLFIVTLAIFPCLLNAECCGSKKIKFERVDNSISCHHFGGINPIEDEVVIYPIYSLRHEYYEKRGDCLISACGDGKKPEGKQSYCGNGSCNIFGCNCDGGCIPGNATESFKALHGNKVRNVVQVAWQH